MSAKVRIAVTLPVAVVGEIDRLEDNRSKFVLEAVRHELQRRRRDSLRRSLRSPHPESASLADVDIAEWTRNLRDEDPESLLEPGAGTPVRWIPGEGWRDDKQ